MRQNSAPGHTLFSTFSAVCWLFGKELSQQLSPSGAVPIGLVSNNWGGTKVEVWTPKKSYAQCNRTDGVEGAMYNAMILPYAEGPMALSGITWCTSLLLLTLLPVLLLSCSPAADFLACSMQIKVKPTPRMQQQQSSTAASSPR